VSEVVVAQCSQVMHAEVMLLLQGRIVVLGCFEQFRRHCQTIVVVVVVVVRVLRSWPLALRLVFTLACWPPLN